MEPCERTPLLAPPPSKNPPIIDLLDDYIVSIKKAVEKPASVPPPAPEPEPETKRKRAHKEHKCKCSCHYRHAMARKRRKIEANKVEQIF